MKRNISYLFVLGLFASAFSISAQSTAKGDFAVRASAEFGIANLFSTATSLEGLSAKASSMNLGAEFDWTFFRKSIHSLDLNVGVGYMPCSVTMNLGITDYSYNASADADMDGNTYRRYYELRDVAQKQKLNYLTVPLYLSYGLRVGSAVKLHVDAGVRLGFKTGNSISESNGTSYSYGVYPEYDNLKIDAPYLNDFGNTSLADSRCITPNASGFICDALVGIGAEFNIYGPLTADVALRYNIGVTNLYKGRLSTDFTEDTAPVTYKVSDGQMVRPLSDYLTKSRLNSLSASIGLAWHF